MESARLSLSPLSFSTSELHFFLVLILRCAFVPLLHRFPFLLTIFSFLFLFFFLLQQRFFFSSFLFPSFFLFLVLLLWPLPFYILVEDTLFFFFLSFFLHYVQICAVCREHARLIVCGAAFPRGRRRGRGASQKFFFFFLCVCVWWRWSFLVCLFICISRGSGASLKFFFLSSSVFFFFLLLSLKLLRYLLFPQLCSFPLWVTFVVRTPSFPLFFFKDVQGLS